jgi:hypothetical protein
MTCHMSVQGQKSHTILDFNILMSLICSTPSAQNIASFIVQSLSQNIDTYEFLGVF